MSQVEDDVPHIQVQTYYYPPADLDASGAKRAALIVQVASLRASFMVWAGASDELPLEGETLSEQPQPQVISTALSDDAENNAHSIPKASETRDEKLRSFIAANGKLAKDWGCAMPSSNPGVFGPTVGTSLFRSPFDSDIALSMAQRLSRRFKKQVFLSIDLPPRFEQGSQLLLEVEKRVLESVQKSEGHA